jgi:hypothetical protein
MILPQPPLRPAVILPHLSFLGQIESLMVINADTTLSSTIKLRSHHIRSVCLLGAGMFLILTILFPKHSNAFSISSTIFSHPARALSQIVLDSNSSFSASSSPSFMSVPGFYLPPSHLDSLLDRLDPMPACPFSNATP